MKARKEHTVPLSNEAISIIKLMRKKHNHEYVFTVKYTLMLFDKADYVKIYRNI